MRGAPSASHLIKAKIGAADDTVMTAPIVAFLAECFAPNAAFTSCRSPRSYSVGRGGHAFSVRAVSGEGTGPAKAFRFRVRRRR